MAYDYSALMGRIVQYFRTQARFAEAMGLSERSMSLKLNNKASWRQDEIIKACRLLEIPDEEVHAYFFVLDVQYG